MTKILTAYVHTFLNGKRVTASPGDEAPDWVKNPKVVKDVVPDVQGTPDDGELPDPADADSSDDSATGEDEASVGEEEATPAAKGKPRGRRKAKTDEATPADKAKALGIEIDSDWSEAEIEAAIAMKQE